MPRPGPFRAPSGAWAARSCRTRAAGAAALLPNAPASDSQVEASLRHGLHGNNTAPGPPQSNPGRPDSSARWGRSPRGVGRVRPPERKSRAVTLPWAARAKGTPETRRGERIRPLPPSRRGFSSSASSITCSLACSFLRLLPRSLSHPPLLRAAHLPIKQGLASPPAVL